MAYWLVKSEPETWSWDDHWNEPEHTAQWDGVRNHQAKNNLKKMQIGDKVFFYHSGKSREIVGILEVTAEAVPDPGNTSFVQVEMCAIEAFESPVSLKQIKAHEALQQMQLVKQSRLSVSRVTEDEWQEICDLSSS